VPDEVAEDSNIQAGGAESCCISQRRSRHREAAGTPFCEKLSGNVLNTSGARRAVQPAAIAALL
jgi:hypothetical protein